MFGYMSFITNQFWISLYMQEVQKLAPLHIAARLLPQAVAGIIWSYLGQALADKVNGTILMAVGGVAYLAGAILLIFIRQDTSYWKFLFPALIITVLGADFQFIISNVRFLCLLSKSLLIL
jgi:nitrate/nitrite transporter NarK